MARRSKGIIVAQPYPRIQDERDPQYGMFDDSKVVQHSYKLPPGEMKMIVLKGIEYANAKSSREILSVPPNASSDEVKDLYTKAGIELFKYFAKYYDDPASTAYRCFGKHYSVVAREQFRNRTLQKARMNSGWRYQFIAKEAAGRCRRFHTVGDLGGIEADFNVQIEQLERKTKRVNIYVSIKNRINTVGGQDFPKVIQALEQVASTDKNREGPYLCVFGIAMERGSRRIKIEQKTGKPHSFNTEVWLSDFLWPFFSNYKYEEIIRFVLEALIESTVPDAMDVEVPTVVIETFGEICSEMNLVDEKGIFNDPYVLMNMFCGKKKE